LSPAHDVTGAVVHHGKMGSQAYCALRPAPGGGLHEVAPLRLLDEPVPRDGDTVVPDLYGAVLGGPLARAGGKVAHEARAGVGPSPPEETRQIDRH
jgi:hypothetical protein